MDMATRAGNVVALNFKDAEMAHPLIAGVTRYWDGLRAGRLVPQRDEIDPREIQIALAYSFILDRAQHGSIRFRLSGRHLNEVLGMEARGMPVRAICEVSHRQKFLDQVERVFRDPALLEVDLRADRGDMSAVRARLALLPLSTNGEINRALGIFVTDARVIDPPMRFQTRGFAVTPLCVGESVFDSRRNLHPAGMEEEMAYFQSPHNIPNRMNGQPPRLRVVEGGKG